MITVVGSGPSPVGRGLGPEIDSGPVVRMHDWGWQPVEDYGERCDFIVIPGPWFAKAFRQAKVSPSVAWLLYWFAGQKYKGAYPREYLGKPIRVYDVGEIASPLLKVGKAPTRGLSAIFMASKIDPTINLVGFDSVLTGYLMEYAAPCPSVMDEARMSKRHDYGLERDVLRSWSLSAGVRLHNMTAA